MDYDWIMFADGSDGTLYWYGKTSLYPITLPTGRMWDEVDDAGIQEIAETINTPRKRLLIIGKKRYVVVARGLYYEP